MNGSTTSISAVGDTITIPSSILSNALVDHLRIDLDVTGKKISGYIKFLPESEQESYDIDGFIWRSNGNVGSSTDFVCTDFIDVADASELVITCRTYGSACPLFGYDADKQPIGPLLLDTNYDSFHYVLPSNIAFVRSSSRISMEKSLIVYY